MRSARILLATAAATAAVCFATPGAAFAVPAGGDWGRDDSSYSRDHDSGSDRDRDKGSDSDHDKGSGKEHDDYSTDHDKRRGRDEPRGGMHTGGGALAAVRGGDSSSNRDDGRFDLESYRDKDKDTEKDKGGGRGSGRDKDEWGGDDHEKPRGGMHTGGGALATPGVTAGGLAVLAVGATGMYALRRKKAAAPAS
ncbi:hypothetical protein [Streptomyces sp. NPDC007905]|uniref:hypothetical protein n=1 Tax=Streptomyces sp. NPDC007905 TaxID=3364788 RepID=UPI0036EF5364